jgi:hypothetical protein
MITEDGPAAATRPGPRPSRSPRRSRRLLGALVVSCAVAGIGGCGEHDEPPGLTKQKVAFDDVPAPVRDAARKAVPGVKLDEAWKNLDRGGKLHSYEVRGRNPADGKIREVRVSLSGEVLETE